MGKARTPKASRIVIPEELPQVIIVGSGQSILHYPYAKAIDSFPRICRFRGFQTAPEDVKALNAGYRFTDIGLNTSQPVINALLTGKDKLFRRANYLITCHRRHSEKRKHAARFFKSKKIKFKTVASSDFERRRNLTSGYLAIMRFLLDYSCVCIHGFCNVDDNIPVRTKKHYFPRKSDNFRMHDLKFEGARIRDLMAQGRVVRLHDLIQEGMIDVEGNRPGRQRLELDGQEVGQSD